jgi:cobalt/nickel transport system permease protein
VQLDRYVAGASPLHRLDARVKVILALVAIVSCVLLPDAAWLAFALTWGLVVLGSVLADVGPLFVLKRSVVALPFALAAVSVVFTLPGQTIADATIGPWTLTATDRGLARFVSIVIRSWLSIQIAVLLVTTTPFPELMHALRHLRVPALLVAVISLMYRYLAVLVDEASRLLRARDARSARLPGRRGPSVVWRAGVAGHMVGQLFLRSYERSDRVYAAMLARGYRGQPMLLHADAVPGADWAVAAAVIVVLLMLQVVGRVPLI